MSSNFISDEETPSPDGESSEDICDGMVDDNELELSDIAHRAMYVQGLENDAFVIVCVELAPQWRALIEEFIPDFDWEATVDSEKFKYIVGRVQFSFCESLCEYLPEYTEVLTAPPPDGKAKGIAIAGKGFSLYEIDPWPLQLQ